MKRVIKVGSQYLGLVDAQSDALKFDDSSAALVPLREAANTLRMHHLINANALDDDRFHTVKLRNTADRMARDIADVTPHTDRLMLDTDPLAD